MHIITLSVDDGFPKSNRLIAALYERYGLSACFNIIADNAALADEWHTGNNPGTDYFSLWNELQARGHEIMPHGLHHEDYPTLPLAEAKASILRCLDIFTARLDGFTARCAVFNMPYNHSSPELEEYLPTVVRAFRTSGDGINPLPYPGQAKLTSTGSGPANCEAHLDAQIDRLLAQPSGWLIYFLHGIDDEGWGPIRATYLEQLLTRLTAIPSVRMLPAGKALELVGG